MSEGRPKRHAAKLPDPDFVTFGTDNALLNSCRSPARDDPKDKKKEDQKEGSRKRKSEVVPGVGVISPAPCKRPSTASASTSALDTGGKKCSKSSCLTVRPICFAGVSEGCSGSGKSSRWYHVSPGEHYCNSCFEIYYRSNKSGFSTFNKWKHRWQSQGKTEPNIRAYLASHYLPYWLQCGHCLKWRQVSCKTAVTPEYVASFYCGIDTALKAGETKAERDARDDCDDVEDERVQQMKEYAAGCLYQPLLEQSPAAPFLTNYYLDCIGMSPISNLCDVGSAVSPQVMAIKKDMESDQSSDSEDDMAVGQKEKLCKTAAERKTVDLTSPVVPGLPRYCQPFVQPEEATKAGSFLPHIMTDDELKEFPDLIKETTVYLALRNLMLALWTLNSKEWLTVEMCHKHTICRGLGRVRFIQLIPRSLNFLTRKGFVNTGLLSGLPPGGSSLPAKYSRFSVLVVGAGPAGLATARQLSHFGTQVTVLEAQSRIGGRVYDDKTMGACVGRGAQIINGCVNNPIALLCNQTGQQIKEIKDRCNLISESGQVVEVKIDNRIDFHFNAMLDNVAEWRRNRPPNQDTNLLDKIFDMHKQFLLESEIKFSEIEEKLIQFHISNLEYACGSPLHQVSALNWDQNEALPQFAGPHGMLTQGYSPILQALAQGLDIYCSTQVTKIDYSDPDGQVKVTSFGGQEFTADKVVVTVPLAVLKKNVIQFCPELPEEKQQAISGLGAGKLEKVALHFPERFWAETLKGADVFGHVADQQSDRGKFSVFYDLTPQESPEDGKPPAILMSYLSGSSVDLVAAGQALADQKVVDMCMEVLRKLFPDQVVPDPIKYLVTHWQHDPSVGMAYSYVPVGCSGLAYDTLAATVQDKVYFAGEATNRQLPQTVAGAYLSGIREAGKIALASANS